MINRYILIFCGVFCFFISKADKQQPVYHLESVSSPVSLTKLWKYKPGDDKSWGLPNFNDSNWDTITLSVEHPSIRLQPMGVKWFRLHLKVAPALFHKILILQVVQEGASEIYLNGKLIHKYGKVGDSITERPVNPEKEIEYIQLDGDTTQIVAIRFSANKVMKEGFDTPALSLRLDDDADVNEIVRSNTIPVICCLLISTVFFTLAIFHLLLFLYYRKVPSNFYYSILALTLSFISTYPGLEYFFPGSIFRGQLNEINLMLYGPCFFLILLLIHSIFSEKYNWFFWLMMALTVIADIAIAAKWEWGGFVSVSQCIFCAVRGIFMVVRAVRQKKPGAWIIATGFILFLSLILLLFFFAVIASYLHLQGMQSTSDGFTYMFLSILFLWVFSIPASMSVYLASDFSRTNKYLVVQLAHVKQLSEQNIAKEKEKQELIERQKEDLVIKIKEATAEVSRQKDELSEKNKEITDSINYARRIQASILPEDDMMRDTLREYMVIYRPKDVVSGDFYWCHAIGDKVIFAVADCTGHGVPGAFMSMIGNSLLNEIVIGEQLTEANTILDTLRSKLITTLQQSAQHVTTRDGMDISLCVWNKKENILHFAGANNSLYLVSQNIATNGSIKETARVKLSNEHLLEILPDKQPIGYQEGKMTEPFTKVIIQLHKGDTIFLTSDGFTDQFGGERNKKFTSKRFRELIASLAKLPIAEQKVILEQTIMDWKGHEEQTDDICVMAVRVS